MTTIDGNKEIEKLRNKQKKTNDLISGWTQMAITLDSLAKGTDDMKNCDKSDFSMFRKILLKAKNFADMHVADLEAEVDELNEAIEEAADKGDSVNRLALKLFDEVHFSITLYNECYIRRGDVVESVNKMVEALANAKLSRRNHARYNSILKYYKDFV